MRALVFTLLVLGAWSYVLKPQELFIVGDAAIGQRFWQPSKAVTIGTTGLVRVSLSEDQCTQDCRSAAVTFNEQGEFKQFPFNNFCGSGGVLTTNSVICHGNQGSHNASGVFISRIEYTLSGLDLEEGTSNEFSFFETPDLIPRELKIAPNTVHFPERQVYVTTGELTLENGTSIHAFFRSKDGISWNMTSVVPFEFHNDASIHRLGETKLMVIVGHPGNYSQATSVFLGSRWEKLENVSYATPLTAWSSPYHTTLYGGVRGRPGVHAMAAGPKKGSEKPIDITQWHNRLATKQDNGIANFSAEYKSAIRFDCLAPFSTDDADGCASSSYVAMTSIGNGTVFFFYDKLGNGFGPASNDRTSTIFAIKAHLNETKEETEHQAKLEEKAKEAEREKQREEARKLAQKEAEDRKKRERREKVKQDKARRAAFADGDRVNFENAARYSQLDGETVIVRDVDPEFVEIEKDTFFF
ncbi:Hypothetical protein, putative [Bodo saltans]|uniref:Membrane-associated protein n=1 Tax=Bodo saltans TaxID=75058 RepID=A0A0S4J078_BODSA|nr:Hypothetical protein, putative [Bodo saltans]|eukprot:CUG15931.1 Hypothetical protein, putative [Bodo saltans]